LCLNGDARASNHLLVFGQTLGALETGASVHPVARVENHSGLVGLELGFDAREGAREGQDNRILGRVIDQPVSVVALARAVGTAVAGKGRVGAGVPEEKIGLASEIVDGAGLSCQDLAGGQGALVGFKVALRVGKMQGVVPDERGCGILVGVEVEIGVLGQENGWLLKLVKWNFFYKRKSSFDSDNSRDFCSGEVAVILIFQVLLVTLYVTLDSTRPGNPWDELDWSTMEKVIES